MIILFFLLVGFFQINFPPFLRLFGAAPNLVLVFVLIWFLTRKESKPSLSFNFLIGLSAVGLFLDLFSGLFFGLITLGLLGTVYLIDWLKKKIFSQINFWTFSILSLSSVLFYNLIILFSYKFFQPSFITNWKYYLVYQIPLEVIYNTILVLLLLFVIRLRGKPRRISFLWA